MKVLLKQDVKNLGRAGEVKEVKEGFARNYLFPRQLAEEVTAGKVKELKVKKIKLEERRQKEKEAALITGEKLKKQVIAINARCGEKGKLFGSITTSDIATAIKGQGFSVDKKKIELDRPIRALGTYRVNIRLHPEVTVALDIAVNKEKGE